MKNLLISAVAVSLAFATVSASAQRKEGGRPAKDAVKAPIEELVLTGKITKEETLKAGKEGKETKIVKYTLTEADGTAVNLSRLKKAGAETIDLVKYVDKDVKITGKGWTETNKNGKKIVHVVSITTIEEVLPPAPAPAAAAAVNK